MFGFVPISLFCVKSVKDGEEFMHNAQWVKNILSTEADKRYRVALYFARVHSASGGDLRKYLHLNLKSQ